MVLLVLGFIHLPAEYLAHTRRHGLRDQEESGPCVRSFWLSSY